MSPTPRTLRIATRASPLARWQADHVADLLREHHPADVTVEVVPVETEGDRRLDVPISEIGGKGVFAKEVQLAVLDGRADLAVHSAKDLPAAVARGLVLAAVPERGDARDALVGSTLEELADGAPVATGSQRRRAQLARVRPDLTFVELRGNMATRLSKVPDGGAILVARAALQRLGLEGHIAEVLDTDVMIPQVGQGALAVECRVDDSEVVELVRAVEHGPSRRCVDAERAFLATLGGDCDLPAGAHATLTRGESGGELRIEAFLASDGSAGAKAVRHTAADDDPESLGHTTATHLRGLLGYR